MNMYAQFYYEDYNYNSYHYYCKSVQAFLNYIQKDLIINKSFTADKWQFDGNILKIYSDGTPDRVYFRRCRYVTITDSNNGVYRFYHVSNVINRTDMTILYLNPDLWAQFLFTNSISLNSAIVNEVIKTNRNIGKMTYDPIGVTNERTIEYVQTASSRGEDNSQFVSSNASIVFCLKYNTYETTTGSITNQELLTINLQRLKNSYIDMQKSEQAKEKASNVNAVDLALAVVGGINGVEKKNLIGITTSAKAEAISAWIVDANNILTYEGNLLQGIITNNEYTGEYTFTADSKIVVKAIPFRITRTFNIRPISPNYQAYFGTLESNIKLERLSGSNVVNIEYVTSNDKLKVIAYQGDRMKDITSAFGVTFTTNTGEVNSLRLMEETFRQATSNTSALIDTSISDSNGLLQASQITQFGIDLIFPQLQKGFGTTINNGDGTTSWRRILSIGANANLKNPYVLILYKSIQNEEMKCSKLGANCDIFINIEDVLNADNLINQDDICFIRSNIIPIGLNQEASDYVINEFRKGIYLINVT